MPYPIYQKYDLLGGESIEVIVGYTDSPYEMCGRYGHQMNSFVEIDGSYSCSRCGERFSRVQAEVEFERLEKLMRP